MKLFILPVATQPRYTKRIIEQKNSSNEEIVVSYFVRKYFEKNKLPSVDKCIELNEVQNGRYYSRIFTLLKSLILLRDYIKRSDSIYIYSSDVLIMIRLMFRGASNKCIYEIGDLREFSKNIIINTLFEMLYRYALKNVKKIIVTTRSFKEYIINKYKVEDPKIIVKENKLDSMQIEYTAKRFNEIGRQFTVGILGFLRYKNCVDFVEKSILKEANYNILIYGDGKYRYDLEKLCDGRKVSYKGQYKYPDDLDTIYSDVDVLFVMYDQNDINVQLALPNKLYEAMYYKKPIIVSSNTYLCEMVKKYKIGWCWNQNEMEHLVDYLKSSRFIDDYNSLRNNFDVINKESFFN